MLTHYFFLFVFFAYSIQAGTWDYNLMTHSDITWNERNEDYLYNYVGQNVAKKNPGLSFRASSPVSKQETKWSFAFQSKCPLIPNDAKILLTKIHKDLIKEIERNKESVQFLAQDLQMEHLPLSYIALKITFFTKNGQIPSPPYVARVHLANNQSFYTLFNLSTQDLDDPCAFD